jgi:hypothetical protein
VISLFARPWYPNINTLLARSLPLSFLFLFFFLCLETKKKEREREKKKKKKKKKKKRCPFSSNQKNMYSKILIANDDMLKFDGF